MKKAAWISFVFAAIVFACPQANAQEAQQNPSLEQQIADIAQSQKRIEQRLTGIEATQRGIVATLQGQRNAVAARPAGGPPPEDMNQVYKINLGSSPLKGSKKAKVTIAEFSDFQCPYSQRFHPVVNDVLKAYPDNVNYVLKNFPLAFHPQSRPAAKAALAAGEQGKYWEMVEGLFQNGAALSEDKFKELAGQLGLDADKFMKDYKDKDAKWEKLIGEDMEVAQSASVMGTPTFYINGKRTNARDLASFKAEIGKILADNKK